MCLYFVNISLMEDIAFLSTSEPENGYFFSKFRDRKDANLPYFKLCPISKKITR